MTIYLIYSKQDIEYLAAAGGGGEGLRCASSALQLLPSAGAHPASLPSPCSPHGPPCSPLLPLLLALCSRSSDCWGGAGVRKHSRFSLGGTAGGVSLNPENVEIVFYCSSFSRIGLASAKDATRRAGGVSLRPGGQRESVQATVLGGWTFAKEQWSALPALLWKTCQRTAVSLTQYTLYSH